MSKLSLILARILGSTVGYEVVFSLPKYFFLENKLLFYAKLNK